MSEKAQQEKRLKTQEKTNSLRAFIDIYQANREQKAIKTNYKNQKNDLIKDLEKWEQQRESIHKKNS